MDYYIRAGEICYYDYKYECYVLYTRFNYRGILNIQAE